MCPLLGGSTVNDYIIVSSTNTVKVSIYKQMNNVMKIVNKQVQVHSTKQIILERIAATRGNLCIIETMAEA